MELGGLELRWPAQRWWLLADGNKLVLRSANCRMIRLVQEKRRVHGGGDGSLLKR